MQKTKNIVTVIKRISAPVTNVKQYLIILILRIVIKLNSKPYKLRSYIFLSFLLINKNNNSKLSPNVPAVTDVWAGIIGLCEA